MTAAVDGMVRRIKKEMGGDPKVIATGDSAEIDEISPLQGAGGLRRYITGADRADKGRVGARPRLSCDSTLPKTPR